MITAGIDIKLNNSARLYHSIRGFMNTRQGKNYHNDAIKLSFNNIYKTTELTGR